MSNQKLRQALQDHREKQYQELERRHLAIAERNRVFTPSKLTLAIHRAINVMCGGDKK